MINTMRVAHLPFLSHNIIEKPGQRPRVERELCVHSAFPESGSFMTQSCGSINGISAGSSVVL